MKRFFALLAALLVTLSSAAAETYFSFSQDAAIPSATPAVTDSGEDGWPRTIVVSLGGDCTIGCTDGQRKRAEGFFNVVKEKGYAWPFSGLVDVFSKDDLTLVNFEGTLTESTDKVEKLFNFKGPAEYTEILKLGAVDAVNLANNHFGDYGKQGKEDTMAALDAAGIPYCAPGAPAIVEVKGVKIGLIGNTFDYKDGKRDISKDVKALREAGCRIVIASFHWGSEYEEYTRDQRNIGRAAIKSGADIVVGHHPHIIQGIELYEERYILYSLGNLVFGGNTDPGDRDAYVAQATFTVGEEGEVAPPALKILPVRTTSLADGTDYRPVFAEGERYDRILAKVLGSAPALKGFENPQ